MQPNDTNFVMRVQNVLTQLPTILVILVGFYVCWVDRRRHPQVATVTAIALAVLLVAVIAMRILPYLAARQVANDMEEVLWRIFVIGVVNNTLTATGLALLLWATFGWRRAEKRRK
jgi:cytochrome bd-type quinol oxidase subunit 2